MTPGRRRPNRCSHITFSTLPGWSCSQSRPGSTVACMASGIHASGRSPRSRRRTMPARHRRGTCRHEARSSSRSTSGRPPKRRCQNSWLITADGTRRPPAPSRVERLAEQRRNAERREVRGRHQADRELLGSPPATRASALQAALEAISDANACCCACSSLELLIGQQRPVAVCAPIATPLASGSVRMTSSCGLRTGRCSSARCSAG